MNDLKLEILEICDKNFNGDAILYIYSDKNLLDAVTLKNNLKKPAVTSISSSPSQSIIIIAKDLENGQPLGTISFQLSLLLTSSTPIKLLLNYDGIQTISSEYETGYILIFCSETIEDDHTLQQLRENSRENDIYRAMKSELEIEKWKNIGLKQIREEMNASELARVSVMKKLCYTVNKYEIEITEIKKKQRPDVTKCGILMDKKRKIEELCNTGKEIWMTKEREYLSKIEKLKESKILQQKEIARLKADKILINAEIASIKNLKNCEKLNQKKYENLDLLEKIELLKGTSKEKTNELEGKKYNLSEAFEHINMFQVHNTELRSYLQTIEEKIEANEENCLSILEIVNNHLDALSITATVLKITENIYKIDNESLHLFIKNNELMTQQDSKIITFVEWLQKNKWKSTAGEECEYINEKSKKLDTVPEEEEEDELLAPYTPVKASKKATKKSPNCKEKKKEFSPILSKKKYK